MPRIIRPEMNGAGRRFAIVAALFNEDIVKRLVDGAIGVLTSHGVKDGDITVAWVPGAFEIPLVARRLAAQGRYMGVICVGAVIQGETMHDVYVSENAARGISEVSRDTGVPCTFGVITALDRAQAEARSGTEVNRGAEAAEAALEMAHLLTRLE
ncbi:MAG: 6,7-dimethyl-8-ribityllumazine synthase [Planctomycetes bacterium]|nr:6,7-dimethyl-8-ribityllumazine synthase [Planctomycetota bacterium]